MWKQAFVPFELRAERQAVRVRAPVRLIEFDAVPGFVRLLEQLVQTHTLALMLHVPQQTGVR